MQLIFQTQNSCYEHCNLEKYIFSFLFNLFFVFWVCFYVFECILNTSCWGAPCAECTSRGPSNHLLSLLFFVLKKLMKYITEINKKSWFYFIFWYCFFLFWNKTFPLKFCFSRFSLTKNCSPVVLKILIIHCSQQTFSNFPPNCLKLVSQKRRLSSIKN